MLTVFMTAAIFEPALIENYAGVGIMSNSMQDMGWQVSLVCEKDAFARRCLKLIHPHAHVFGDVDSLTDG